VENAVEWLVAQGIVSDGDEGLSVPDGGAGLRTLLEEIPTLPGE